MAAQLKGLFGLRPLLCRHAISISFSMRLIYFKKNEEKKKCKNTNAGN